MVSNGMFNSSQLRDSLHVSVLPRSCEARCMCAPTLYLAHWALYTRYLPIYLENNKLLFRIYLDCEVSLNSSSYDDEFEQFFQN